MDVKECGRHVFGVCHDHLAPHVSDGIVVSEHVTYKKLISTIAGELKIDETRKKIKARYIVEVNASPLFICNEMSVKLYVLQFRLEDCVWIFKASCRRGIELFKVRFFQDVHTCPLKDHVFTQLQATVGFVSGFAALKLVNYKRIHTPNDIIEAIKNTFGVDINYQKAWRAKERTIKMLRGKPAYGYRQMARYVYMLNSVYPSSHIRIHKFEDNKFMYLFVALQPLKSGFEYCRPEVVVDGAHLSGAYKGTFVSASTLDGAGCILPIAYGVVDSENDNSWTWFFENFKIDFGERDSMCVVSDRHESIIKVVSVVYPNVPHLACIWHLWKNVCTNFRKSKDRLSDIYYAMAKAYCKDEFGFF
ncbi:uncharacterized protein LOC124889624 [Capsicum annuum]|uniref:uncharacterized protein LOC124889624 n=1 Tax=Capsicum annuum TaxID=4072 RepID=UPI001FB16126|nr:uncharacterized protein LOC124889624 [Capsicum annuum]